VDLETLDVLPSARIVSIGLVTFDGTGPLDNLHLLVDWREDHGTISPDTLAWHLHNAATIPGAADEILVGLKEEQRFSLPEAMAHVLRYCAKVFPENAPVGLDGLMPSVWCQGNFDGFVIRHHCNVLGLRHPWQYWQERDSRVVTDLWRTLVHDWADQEEALIRQTGMPRHTALTDAALVSLRVGWYLREVLGRTRQIQEMLVQDAASDSRSTWVPRSAPEAPKLVEAPVQHDDAMGEE
jgi:hypothetical protein